ncbi:hypothetical protein CL673_04285 [Candidatus Bathyarchaeota archaeon]|nr:hypothetical protein [Candidatus Bathyarchaeota archaeon]MDP6049136.1 tyrosine-type recombinase/integrase [Candidatus Bathyarchaeota archaeon]
MIGLKEYSENKTPLENFEFSLGNVSEKTRNGYLMQLDQFCKYLGDSPNELYAIESVNQDSRESGDKLALRMAFEDFRKHLIENKGLNPNTAKNYKKALNRFLRANGLSELPRDEGKSVEANDVNLIIKDQIRHLLETAGNDYRLRALILTAKDTGLRVSDLAQLTVGYFNGMRIDHDSRGREFRYWIKPLRTKKTGVNAYVCLGPESIQALKDYIGNNISGPIFRTIASTKGGKMRITRGPRRGEQISRKGSEAGLAMQKTAITNVFINHSRKLRQNGIRITAHSFRKFFLNAWTSQGLKDYGKRYAGKSLGNNDGAYTAKNNGILGGKYKELYDEVLGLEDTRTAEELKRTQNEINQLKTQLIELQRNFILLNRNHIPTVVQALGENQLPAGQMGSLSVLDWQKMQKGKESEN